MKKIQAFFTLGGFDRAGRGNHPIVASMSFTSGTQVAHLAIALLQRASASRPLMEVLNQVVETMYQSRKVALIVGDRVCTDELRGPLCRISHSARAMVAILGDQPVESLKAQFRMPGVFYMGDQGLQISGPGIAYTEPEPGLLRMALQLLTQEVKSRVEPIRGSHVEVGTLTCNVDYRSVSPRRRGQVRRAVASAVFEVRQLFRCQEEQGVCTLRPNAEWSRPSAVRWLLANAVGHQDAVIYIGNDHGDEEVYRALPDAITVKVGDPQKTAARYTLASSKELARFLSWLDVTLSMR